jgi:hypothetical protein
VSTCRRRKQPQCTWTWSWVKLTVPRCGEPFDALGHRRDERTHRMRWWSWTTYFGRPNCDWEHSGAVDGPRPHWRRSPTNHRHDWLAWWVSRPLAILQMIPRNGHHLPPHAARQWAHRRDSSRLC